jgi:hypothetical protein
MYKEFQIRFQEKLNLSLPFKNKYNISICRILTEEKQMKRYPCAILLVLLGVPFMTMAQAQEDEWPPRDKGVTLSMVLGPEGMGGGIGYVWHDVAGEPERFLQIYDVITDTAFQAYFVKYIEPTIFTENDQIETLILYVNRTGSHYFGIGPDTEIEDAACLGKEIYWGSLGYAFRLPADFGITISGRYHRTDLRDTDLEEPEFHEDYPELDQPISEVYPDLYESDMFQDMPMTHAVSLSLFHDNQEGRHKAYPTRGGYEKITVTRVDEALGADWNYWKYTAEVAHFIPLLGLTSFKQDPYNILALYARWDRMDGKEEEIPFWEYPALGHTKISIADFFDETGLRGYWEKRYADQNRAMATVEFRHRVKANWYPKYKEPENELLAEGLKSIKNFVYNTSWVFFYDTGQVWSDEQEELEDEWKNSYGLGWVFYFDPGHNMRVTVAYSDELSNYIIFAYNQLF